MRTLYLDTNVYSYLADAGASASAAAWLVANGWEATASMLNLIELARAADRPGARRRVEGLTCVAPTFETPPFTCLLTDEFLAEVRRAHPAWLKPGVNLLSRAEALARIAAKWAAVRSSADAAFERLPAFEALHLPLEEALEAEQREQSARRRRGGRAVDAPVPERYRHLLGAGFADEVEAQPTVERFARLTALDDWGQALFGRTPANDLRDWAAPHLQPFDLGALAEFWLREVNMVAVPHHLARAAVRYFQPNRTVRTSNRNDLDQANWMLRSDVFVSADRAFVALLNQARGVLRGIDPDIRLARLGLFDAGQAPLAALQAALDEAA